MSHSIKGLVFAWVFALVIMPLGVLFSFGAIAANTPEARAKNEAFKREHLLPLAQFVIDFREKNKRLPTRREFLNRPRPNPNRAGDFYGTKSPDLWFWGKEGVDFIVSDWRGEWMEYYQSWNGKVFIRDNSPLSHAAAED